MSRASEKALCWNCSSTKYVNVPELEHCPDCGIRCCYRGGGANQAYEEASERHWATQDAVREQALKDDDINGWQT